MTNDWQKALLVIHTFLYTTYLFYVGFFKGRATERAFHHWLPHLKNTLPQQLRKETNSHQNSMAKNVKYIELTKNLKRLLNMLVP